MRLVKKDMAKARKFVPARGGREVRDGVIAEGDGDLGRWRRVVGEGPVEGLPGKSTSWKSTSCVLLCLDPREVPPFFSSAVCMATVEDAGWRPLNRHGR